MPSKTTTYRQAGVDLHAGDEFESRIAPLVRRTYGPRVISAHGGFAGAFRLDYDERLLAHNYRQPVLVSCTDGVGSKVLIAARAKRYDTVGIDLVAMSVNDMLTCGAEPLFFLDYIAAAKLSPRVIASIVEGVVAGCEQAGCALLGGETAEMPDLYQPGHFDLAGFVVGVVEKSRMICPGKAAPGDDVIGLPSSGIHSNGYALVRRVLLEQELLPLHKTVPSLHEPLVDALLRPTRIYAKAILAALRSYRRQSRITGMAHITGGGLPGNLPRALPANCHIVLRRGSWSIPPIFGLLQRYGVAEDEMYRVFNMGIGMALIVRPSSTRQVMKALLRAGEEPVVIGRVHKGPGEVEFR